MTAQATRDALAEMDEYKREPASRNDVTGVVLPERWYKNGRSHPDGHPHPPTLDGADAAVTAAGYVWGRGWGVWSAMRVYPASTLPKDCDTRVIEVPDTGDKIADLYALALCCRKAMEERK